MIRIALVENPTGDSEYQMLVSTGTDSITDILVRKQINPDTNSIFMNGRRLSRDLFEVPLRDMHVGNSTVFITIKRKSV